MASEALVKDKRRLLSQVVPLMRSPMAGSLGTSAFLLVLGTATGVLLARELGPSGRGLLAAVVLWPTLLSTVGTLGLPEALAFAAARRRSDIGALAGTAAGILLCQSGILVITGIVLIPVVLASHGEEAILLSLAYLVYIPCYLTWLYGVWILNGSQHFAVFQVLRLAINVVNIAGILLLIMIGKLSVGNVLIVYVITYGCLALASSIILVMLEGTFEKPRGALARELLSFGVKSHWGNVSGALNERLDQLIISVFLSVSSLGIYVVAVTLTSVNVLIGTAVANIALPVVSGLEGFEARKRVAMKYMYLTACLTVAATACMLVATPYLVKYLFGPAFSMSSGIALILLPATVFLSLGKTARAILRGMGRPLDTGISEFIALGVTVLSLAVFLPLFGIEGAAVASLLAYATSTGYASLRLRSVFSEKQGTKHTKRLVPDIRRGHRQLSQSVDVLVSSWRTVLAGGCLVFVAVIVGGSVARFELTVQLVVVGGLAAVLVGFWLVLSFGFRRIGEVCILLAGLTIAMNGVRVTNWLTISDVFLVGAAMFLFVTQRQWQVANRSYIVALVGVGLVAVGGSLSSFASEAVSSGLSSLVRFSAASVGIILIFYMWNPSKIQLFVLTIAVVMSAVGSGLYALIVEHASPYNMRVEGLTVHPNHLAMASVLCFGPALALCWRHSIVGLFGVFSSVVLVLAVYVSGSRAGVLGLAVALLVVMLSPKGLSLARWLAGVAFVGSAGVVLSEVLSFNQLALSRNGAIGRLFNEGTTSSVSNQARMSQLTESVAAISHNPLLGVGFDTARDAHNLFLQVWSAAGVVGLVGLMLVVWVILVQPWLSVRSTCSSDMMVYGMLASVAGFLSVSMFQPQIWDRYVWFLLSLAIAQCARMMTEEREFEEGGTGLGSLEVIGVIDGRRDVPSPSMGIM